MVAASPERRTMGMGTLAAPLLAVVTACALPEFDLDLGQRGGAAEECEVPTGVGTCDPVSQCGCGELSCDVLDWSDGSTGCVEPGEQAPFGICDQTESECPVGTTCFEGLCRTLCESAADCARDGADARCRVVPASTASFGVGVCTRSCDPTAPSLSGEIVAACGPGATCVPSSEGEVDCEVAGDAGDGATCASSGECRPGFGCDPSSGQCAAYCTVAGGECQRCSDACRSARNGICEDGDRGAEGADCAFGTDCTDCGARVGACTTPESWPQTTGGALGVCTFAQGGDGECDLVGAAGCEPGERCDYSAEARRTVCSPAGTVVAHSLGCRSDADCAPGSGCVAPSGTVGTCVPYCRHADDCGAGALRCLPFGGEEFVRQCFGQCDPVVPFDGTVPFDACVPGAACEIWETTTVCRAEAVPTGTQGVGCEDVGGCAAGFTCRDEICRRYCDVHADDCDRYGGSCEFFADLVTPALTVGICTGTANQRLFAASGTVPIPDGGLNPGPARSTIAVAQDGRVEKAIVGASVDHDRLGDLSFSLVAPDGTEVLLARSDGLSGMARDTVRFADDARSSYAERVELPEADGVFFRPEEPLAGLGSLATIRGNWELLVTDERGGIAGTLVEWTLRFDVLHPEPSAEGVLALNEALANALPGQPDWVEVANHGERTESLQGCRLVHTDANGVTTGFAIDWDLPLAGGAQALFVEDEGEHPLTFDLDAHGFALTLECAGEGLDTWDTLGTAWVNMEGRSLSPDPRFSGENWLPTPHTVTTAAHRDTHGIGTPGAPNIPHGYVDINAFDGVSGATIGASSGLPASLTLAALDSKVLSVVGPLSGTAELGVLGFTGWPATMTGEAYLDYALAPAAAASLLVDELRFTVLRPDQGPTNLVVRTTSGRELLATELGTGEERFEVVVAPPLLITEETHIEFRAWGGSEGASLAFDDLELDATF
ncbi:MAG: hypothetical protein JW751_26980 [Polyangiaceae bacterium]|nr:hypothetical protein [Polyangiaceae bacterium]